MYDLTTIYKRGKNPDKIYYWKGEIYHSPSGQYVVTIEWGELDGTPNFKQTIHSSQQQAFVEVHTTRKKKLEKGLYKSLEDLSIRKVDEWFIAPNEQGGAHFCKNLVEILKFTLPHEKEQPTSIPQVNKEIPRLIHFKRL